MKIEKINWVVRIDGKDYGNYFRVNSEIKDRSDLNEFVDLIAQNIRESLQMIVFGLTDSAIEQDKAQKKFGL